MSTQIVYTVRSNQNGTQVVSGVNMQQPITLGGPGVPRDDDFLTFWGLRASADATAVLIDNVTVSRQITLQMAPSVTATGTVTTSGPGEVSAITITAQGQDYVRPPVPVIADTTGAGAAIAPLGLQVLATVQVYIGSNGYTNPTAKAVGYLAPGGTAALFSVTVVAGSITAVTCTNTAANGPYAQPPTIVITDPTGTGASWRARCGVHPTVTVVNGLGTNHYTAPTISFTPYFKVLCPDTNVAAQGTAIKGFMAGRCMQAAFWPTFELPTVVS
jgi:hypothetical protein